MLKNFLGTFFHQGQLEDRGGHAVHKGISQKFRQTAFSIFLLPPKAAFERQPVPALS